MINSPIYIDFDGGLWFVVEKSWARVKQQGRDQGISFKRVDVVMEARRKSYMDIVLEFVGFSLVRERG